MLACLLVHTQHPQARASFIVGWFLTILLAPLEVLQHGFAREIRYTCAFGLSSALFAGVSLLWRPSLIDDSTAQTA